MTFQIIFIHLYFYTPLQQNIAWNELLQQRKYIKQILNEIILYFNANKMEKSEAIREIWIENFE